MALSPALQKLVSNAANKYQRSSGDRIKPKEGMNRYRIVIPNPDEQFWADLGVHWIKAEENGKPFAVVGCSDVCFGEPCEIDTAINEAIKNAYDEDSRKLYESWRAKKTVLLNVLDRSKGSADPDKVQILEITGGTFGNIMGLVQQFAEEGVDLLDSAEGLDIMITRSGKGLQTEYAVNTAPGSSKPVTKAHIGAVNDLKQHINREYFKGEEQKALTFIAQTAQIDLPRIGQAAKTPTAALTSRAAVVKPEPEKAPEVDEDDIAQIEREEEAAKPAKTTAATKTAASVAAAKAAAQVEEEAAETAVDDGDIDDVLADLDNL